MPEHSVLVGSHVFLPACFLLPGVGKQAHRTAGVPGQASGARGLPARGAARARRAQRRPRPSATGAGGAGRGQGVAITRRRGGGAAGRCVSAGGCVQMFFITFQHVVFIPLLDSATAAAAALLPTARPTPMQMPCSRNRREIASPCCTFPTRLIGLVSISAASSQADDDQSRRPLSITSSASSSAFSSSCRTYCALA